MALNGRAAALARALGPRQRARSRTGAGPRTHRDGAGRLQLATSAMTSTSNQTEPLVCAGYFLGHPALGPDPRRDPAMAPTLTQLATEGRYARPTLFFDLDAALQVARATGGVVAAQGLWLPLSVLGRVRREVAGTPIATMLARDVRGPDAAAVASGHDVVGFGGELMLSFAREEAGQDLCRDLGLPSDPPPFLPKASVARRLAEVLNDDDLGAPVLWARCWRTVHAALTNPPS